MSAQSTEYDKVAYPSQPHPQAHPDRLAVVGALFGLEPAAIDHCRVLEVGCGDGTHLAPMAWALPGSEWVGVDLASRPVQEGRQMARELGLANLRLVQCNLTEVTEEWGRFDYIIAHGLYSWVPAGVRERLLALCDRLLAPQGIAFISYNALPGCHLRQMVREMMLFHVRSFDSAEERLRQAVALARFLSEGQDTSDEYRRWMKAELARILEHSPGHLYHDELAGVNDAFYFTQFMEQAHRHGLQYLGEADYFEMSDHTFHDGVRQTLARLGIDRLLREQYLDFLKCRRFRQTLLCRREAQLGPQPDPGKIAAFFVSSSAICKGRAFDLRAGRKCVFEAAKGVKCETDLPLGKAALMILGSSWPLPLPFGELLHQTRQRLDAEGISAGPASPENLSAFLLRLYEGGAVELRTQPPPVARHAGQYPVVHPLARWQAVRSDFVTSLFHVPVRIDDEIGRVLLQWLDGTLDRPALLGRLWAFLQSKDALVTADGAEAEARHELEANLEKNLEKLARLGLLVQ